jgi:hypothetical protein
MPAIYGENLLDNKKLCRSAEAPAWRAGRPGLAFRAPGCLGGQLLQA